MPEPLSTILVILFLLILLLSSGFASFQQGREDHYAMRVEKLKLRQKRRLLQRKRA